MTAIRVSINRFAFNER